MQLKDRLEQNLKKIYALKGHPPPSVIFCCSLRLFFFKHNKPSLPVLSLPWITERNGYTLLFAELREVLECECILGLELYVFTSIPTTRAITSRSFYKVAKNKHHWIKAWKNSYILSRRQEFMSLEASRCFTAMSPAEFERVLIPSNATAMP